jgi:hypothetical protein
MTAASGDLLKQAYVSTQTDFLGIIHEAAPILFRHIVSPHTLLKTSDTVHQATNPQLPKTILVMTDNLLASFPLGAATYSG